MGLFDILTGPVSGLVGSIGGIIDNLHTSDEEKEASKLLLVQALQSAELEMERELSKRIEAQERVLVTELQQDDNYTKRARPTVVYVGLGAFLFNYVLVPTIALINGTVLVPIEFPAEFWYGWSGIVATWTIGRSYEKKNKGNSSDTTSTIMKAITG